MAEDRMTESDPVYPLPTFHFQVEWDAEVMSFQEVTGLDMESQPLEYRSGDGPVFSPVNIPALKMTGNVTLRKGVLNSDNKFLDWFNQIKMNTIKRVSVTISLLDEAGVPTMVWTLANAWPTKITGIDMASDGKEVAIESIEIAHEGITVANR